MEFTFVGQTMRRAGIAILAAAISAKAGMVPYASNVPPLPYSIGGLMVNDSGDPGLPQAASTAPVETVYRSSPSEKTGNFPNECHACSTQANTSGPLMGSSLFALEIRSVISEVTGNNVAEPFNATMPYQQASAPSAYSPSTSAPVAAQTFNAGSGTFFSEATGYVATPWMAAVPYQQASAASAPQISNFVPAPDPGFGNWNPTFSVNWSSPLVPSTWNPPTSNLTTQAPLLGGQFTIQPTIYQTTTTVALVNGVPEPATFSLIGLALLGLSVWGRSRAQRT